MIFLSMMLIATILSSTVLFLYFYFRYHQPSRGRIEKDRLALEDVLRQPAYTLRPWAEDALGSLCALPYPRKRLLGWKDQHSGVLKTIHDEPVAAWAFHRYKSALPHYLLVLRIHGESARLALRIRGESAFLFENERHTGTFEADGRLTDPRSGGTIALLRKGPEGSRELLLGNRLIGFLTPPQGGAQRKPTAFVEVEPTKPGATRMVRIISLLWLVARQEGLPLPV
jgi:hypothetical protein